MFSSSGAKIFKKMENYKFPRVFFIFYHFFIIFASSGGIDEKWQKLMKNDKKMKKNEKKKLQKMKNCNFPRVFIIFLSFFNHFSSFLLPVVQKFSKKWKITIFLEFFSFLNHFFIQWWNWWKMTKTDEKW